MNQQANGFLRSIKDELINTVYNEIVSRFERLRIDVGDDLTQRQAVQWMFDLRFVTELLGGKARARAADKKARKRSMYL